MTSANLPAPQPNAERAVRLRHLTRRLATDLADQLNAQPPTGRIVDEARARLHQTISRYRDGGSVDDATAIRLSMDLRIVRVRDEAWLASQVEPVVMTAVLLDVADRIEPAFLAPVGSLLAFTAWHLGERDAACRAVAEVLAREPFYSMALLIQMALQLNVSAGALRGRMPTLGEIDIMMGPPRPDWLQPLQQILADYLKSVH
ncbi:DUF4192 family protein [Nonomuraea sp. MCN248]|uniref:DUF4192 family protein n=1 Tax=Nonomuraea corallina TaxID=2989783 RepID=A0ABT4SHE5_9ACTN|nr:DUF4192 family protein [Nonomuraea corallina]MDA0636622.1 DUF4192 family protein [Nonomuraea corallina]